MSQCIVKTSGCVLLNSFLASGVNQRTPIALENELPLCQKKALLGDKNDEPATFAPIDFADIAPSDRDDPLESNVAPLPFNPADFIVAVAPVVPSPVAFGTAALSAAAAFGAAAASAVVAAFDAAPVAVEAAAPVAFEAAARRCKRPARAHSAYQNNYLGRGFCFHLRRLRRVVHPSSRQLLRHHRQNLV